MQTKFCSDFQFYIAILIKSGGTEIKVWDVLCANRLLARFHHHHKTVTCMCLASKGSRLLSGSLDRHVNVYDMSTFQKVHSLDYPNSVLSIGISVRGCIEICSRCLDKST